MPKYFVISSDPLTADQEKALVEKIREWGAAWWHWLPNFWLLSDRTDDLTAADIRDAFGEVAHSPRCMVLQVEPKTWAGRTRPDAQGRDMTEWVKRFWPHLE